MRELELQELQAYCPLGIDLEKEIGHGSYGRVYKLKDKNEVIKVLDPAKSRPDRRLEPKDYEQFKTELDYACRITHLKNPNLMPVLGVYSHVIQPQGDEKRMIFMLHMPLRKNLMELAEEKIKSGAQPNEDDIIRIVCDLCHGLESLHQKKVVIEGKGSTMEKFSIPGPLIHGDIKPDNVFIHNESNAVRYYQLGDFGACFRTGSGWIPGQKLYSNTHYTAPESSDDEISPAYDVFSLGFMLYWWMNGWQSPEKARKARFDSDFEQRFRLSNMSPELWRVFMKATAESWQNRYATAAEMRKALESAQETRNARIHEVEKKAAEAIAREDGQKTGWGEGVVDTLLVESLAVLGGYLVKKGYDKLTSKGKGKENSAPAQAQRTLPTVRKGEINFADGLIYRGEIVDGQACGHGILYCPDGGSFEGAWNNNGIDPNEEGTFHFSNGSFLKGQWTIVNAEKDGYFGMMLDGECCGWGKQSYPTGGCYCGEFKNGFPDGKGSYYTKGGERFTGNWDYFRNPEYKTNGLRLNGEFCGYAELHYITGSRHIGEFRDGAPCGPGIYIAKNGTEMPGIWSHQPQTRKSDYTGTILNGMKNGWGELSLRNGNKYIGEFMNDEITGWGMHYDKHGSLLREGYWQNGSPIG